MEVNSQSGQTAYTGSTIKYELNKTYHVAVSYNRDLGMVTMKVNDKQSGQELWSYFIKTTDQLNGMRRLWIGAVGDYGQQNIYAQGYLDNVRITTPGTVTAAPTDTAVVPVTTALPTPTKKVTSKTTVPTAYPTTTPQSRYRSSCPLLRWGSSADVSSC